MMHTNEINEKTVLPHVSRRASKRVRGGMQPPTICRYCSGPVELVNNREIYQGRSYGDWPYAYVCFDCDAYVGLHPHTDIPLGTLADRELRAARKQHKAAFETLRRQTGRFASRGQAYAWLAEHMGIPGAQCHWGLFEVAQCKQAGQLCRTELGAAT